jgi:phosphoribosylformylglycinamidine (FGAM) synthase-like enzyme
VSLYNQTGETAILPTPVVAILGVIDDVTRRTPTGFQAEGDAVFLLGETREELSGSEWAHVVHGHLGGLPPRVDLEAERALSELLAAGVGLLTSAHDLADGGLAQTLAESCLRNGVGASIRVGGDAFVGLFAESAARVLVTVTADRADDLVALAETHGVPVVPIGRTGGDALVVADQFEIPVVELRETWTVTLPAALG